jgi:DNA polymerase
MTVLNELNQHVCNCQLCPELVRNRTKTVFGVGNILPRIVFFGEAPGADEDKTGEPFVGKAGQLLTKIIEASQLKREDVYIMNALKCRPPNNRTPTDTEIENCRLFFETQLAVLKPEFIVCLGAVAVRAVLNSKQSVGSLRGRFHQAYGARVMVTYHPSYLLRTESAKKYTWDDMKMLIAELGITLPGKN